MIGAHERTAAITIPGAAALERCADCAAPTTFQVFDGEMFVPCCLSCTDARAHAPAPRWRLDGPWVVGHATMHFAPHAHPINGVPAIVTKRPGAFNAQLQEQSEIDAWINHDAARWLGSTTEGSLQLAEDAHGLCFLLRVSPTDHGLMSAMRDHRVTGVSLGPARARSALSAQRVRRADIPDYCYELTRYPIRQMSICVMPMFPCVAGTWVRLGDDSAMKDLYEMLRAAVAQRRSEHEHGV